MTCRFVQAHNHFFRMIYIQEKELGSGVFEENMLRNSLRLDAY